MRNKPKNDYSQADWRNQERNAENYRKFKFYRARFEFGKFTNCNFSAVSAKNSCFIKTDLTGCDFSGANLEGSNFGGAILIGVNFKGAILRHVNFEGANTEGACFTCVSLHKTRKLVLSEKQVYELIGTEQCSSKYSAAEIIETKANKTNSVIIIAE